MNSFFRDKSISNPDEDKFGRREFAKSIADALAKPLDTDSIVFAIEGIWGSGKSSVLNMIEFYLKKHKTSPLVTKIDSWLLSGSENLLETFLIQLASQFGSLDPGNVGDIAKKTLEFAKLLSPLKLIPGGEPWVSGVETIIKAISTSTNSMAELSKFDLRKRKDQISKSIEFYDKQIVVIIDDIDRLEPNEIRQVFQLVKAVADFNQVTYLLAYDPGPVHKALSYEGNYDGAKYLEKIVQVSYTLPRIGYRSLKKYFLENLMEFSSRYNLSADEVDRLQYSISSGGLSRVIRHPRDVVRLINRLRISVPQVRNEVNFSDIIGYELLSIRFPKVAEIIRQRPYDFIGNKLNRSDLLMADYENLLSPNSDKNILPKWKSDIWEPYNEEDQKTLSILLDFLFPGFCKVKNLYYITQEVLKTDLCIRDRDPLLKLLSLGLDDEAFSSVEIKEFLSKSESRNRILNDHYEANTLEEWFGYLCIFLDYPIDDPKTLCNDIVEFLMKTNFENSLTYQGLVRNFSFFINSVIEHQSSLEGRNDIFLYLSDLSCLEVAESVVLYQLDDHGLWLQSMDPKPAPKNMQILSKEIVEKGRDLWIKNVRAESENIDKFLMNKCLKSIVIRWGQLLNDDFHEVKSFTSKLLPSSSHLSKFLEEFKNENAYDVSKFFEDLELLKDCCQKYSEKDSLRKDLWEKFIHIKDKDEIDHIER